MWGPAAVNSWGLEAVAQGFEPYTLHKLDFGRTPGPLPRYEGTQPRLKLLALSMVLDLGPGV